MAKSGPGIISRSSPRDISGSLRYAMVASITSPRLWVGIFVAIPTAIPVLPDTSMLGTWNGRNVGSVSVPSKLGINLSLKYERSFIHTSSVYLDILASVYRIAAAPEPSTAPKLPCPSTSGIGSFQFCAIFTSPSYIELSPWGWNLPMVSPTILALFLCGLSELARLFSEYNILLCTGFSPSLTSGSALSVITDMA